MVNVLALLSSKAPVPAFVRPPAGTLVGPIKAEMFKATGTLAFDEVVIVGATEKFNTLVAAVPAIVGTVLALSLIEVIAFALVNVSDAPAAPKTLTVGLAVPPTLLKVMLSSVFTKVPAAVPNVSTPPPLIVTAFVLAIKLLPIVEVSVEFSA